MPLIVPGRTVQLDPERNPISNPNLPNVSRLPPYVKVFPAPTAAQPRNTSPPGEIVDLVNMYNDVLVRVNGGSTLTQALSSHNVTPAMFQRRRLIAETWIADKGEVTKSLKGSKGYGLEELHTRCKKVATSSRVKKEIRHLSGNGILLPLDLK